MPTKIENVADLSNVCSGQPSKPAWVRLNRRPNARSQSAARAMIFWEELPCESKVGRNRVAVVIDEHFDVIRSGSARSVSGIRGRMESRVRAINLSGGGDAARKIRVATGERSPLH